MKNRKRQWWIILATFLVIAVTGYKIQQVVRRGDLKKPPGLKKPYRRDRNMAANGSHASLKPNEVVKENLTSFLPNESPFFMSCNGPTIASHSFGNLTGSKRPKWLANSTRANSAPCLWILNILLVWNDSKPESSNWITAFYYQHDPFHVTP